MVLASLALTIFALADCVSTDESRAKGLPKILWVLLIVFIPWIGPIVWLLVGKDRSNPEPTGIAKEFNEYFSPSNRARRRDKKLPSRPIAPDEDPEFLAALDKQIRQERRDRLQKPSETKDAETEKSKKPEDESEEPEADAN